jgi:hypothetical protein
MRGLLSASLLVLASACASTPSGDPEQTPSISLSAALQADLLEGGSIDLNADLVAGRPVALIFWQAW